MNVIFFVPGFSIAISRPLRRTLVRFVFWSTVDGQLSTVFLNAQASDTTDDDSSNAVGQQKT